MIQGEETQAKDQQQHTQQHDHIENAEISELQSQSGFYARVREQTERFASTRLGQFVIVRVDRALKLLEDTTKWSLPQDKNSSNVVLERPLPWVPFLLLIILLRLARIWLSVGALMIGNGPVSPRDTIYFIQTRRRKLRAIRLHGLRVMRDRQTVASSLAGKSFTQKVSQWMSRAICRPGVHHNEPQQQLVQPNQSVSKRPREEDNVQEQNLTINEILNSYANANSEDDSDFVPNPDDEIESSTSSESDSESHSSEEISSSEVLDNAEEHKRNKKLLYTNQPEREKTQEKEKEKEKEQEKEQEKKLDRTKIMSTTSNGNNIDSNSNSKEQKEVVSQCKEEELDWKSSMGLASSAFLNTRICNNTAAAAIPDQFNSNSNPSSNSNPNPDPNPTPENENDNDNDDSDTDSGSAKTVCTAADPQQEIPPDQPIQPITQSPPTVETLTPATSSEDIFYSPIGSPTYFNTVFQPHTPLQNVTITSVATHSTPNSEMEEAELNANNEIEVARHNISLARQSLIEPEVVKQQQQQDENNHQQQQQQQQKQQQQQQQQPVKQQQQHHQQQKKFNHSHQRFRGRNIR